MQSTDVLIYEVRDRKAYITMNRPQRMNALSRELIGDLPGFDDVNNCTKPVIAAIDGYCMAGGMEIALYCDIRLATRASSFAMPEPKRNLLSGPSITSGSSRRCSRSPSAGPRTPSRAPRPSPRSASPNGRCGKTGARA